MDFVVYGDVLVAMNFIINLLILKLCSALSGVKPRTITYYFSALVGAICSFAIFLPMQGLGWDLAYRIVTAALVVMIAYGKQPLAVFGRLLAVFLVVSFLLAGVVIGLWFLFPSGGYAYRNGVVYFNIRPLALLVGVALAYLLATGFNRIFLWRRGPHDSYPMVISRGGRQIQLEALADTGNRLTEPFSGRPVVVAAFGAVAELLTHEEQVYILEERLDSTIPESLRMVSYHTVDRGGILKAFRPDSIQVQVGGHPQRVDAYVAVSTGLTETAGCRAVFHPQLIQLLVTEQPGSRGIG